MNTADETKEALRKRAVIVEVWLDQCLKTLVMPEGLRTAMEYSLMAGGKRIRPVLCLACAALFGAREGDILPFAGAIECIHTYSLIHDDLPAMDNDDLRRGKPSNHKQFDEATAILTGDALLTDSFSLMASVSLPADRVLSAIATVADAAGSRGMVGGQFFDMQYTARKGISLEKLTAMHAMKTGALLTASCTSGALLAGACARDVEALQKFGKALGITFQIVDDILDQTGTEKNLGKPVGSDQQQKKTTYVSSLGIAKSLDLAQHHKERALEALAPFSGKPADFLCELTHYIVSRGC